MSKFTMPILFASAALLAAVPAAAQYGSQGGYDQSAPNSYNQSAGGPDASYGGDRNQQPRRQRGMHMSLEQRAMLRAELRNQVQNMPREQRAAYRQQMRAEWRSMDPGQRQQKLAEMERHWNALPSQTRDRILAKVSQHNGHRSQGQGRQHDQQYQDHGDQGGGDRYRNGGGPRDSDSYAGEPDSMDRQ